MAVFLAAMVLAIAAEASSEQFAREEFARYAPNHRATFAIEKSPTESFTISKDGDGIRIVGSNDFMLLAGTYQLLDQMGCRFLAPHFDHYRGTAEVIAIDRALSLDALVTRKPKLKFRKLYVEEGHSHDAENLRQLVEWMPKVGYNTLVVPTDYGGSGRVRWDNWREMLTPELQKRGITIEVGGHGYENFINGDMEGKSLFKTHPDWFAKDEKGTPQRSQRFVFCTSNPAAVEYVTNNVISYLKARPEIQIFDFWPPDGAKWCACDACKKLGEPPDRQAILLKQVQEKLKPVRPDVRLEIIAYSSYLEPPKTAAVDKDVLVDFCPISQHFDAQINDLSNKNKTYADALTAWRKSFAGDISIYSYYRKYAWDSLPVVIPHYMQNDLQWYAGVPVQGVSVYSEPNDWFTYELNHYTLAALAWDPDADVDALVDKFCDARYGRHAKAAREALMTLQDTVRIYGSVPHVPLKDAASIEQAAKRVKDQLWQLAAALRHGGTDAEMRSVNRLMLMCTYAERDLEIQQLRATNAPREQIVRTAKELHAWVKSHADDGVFLIKGNRLNQNRMLTRYGVGEAKKAAATLPE